jgi:hypothetical protein
LVQKICFSFLFKRKFISVSLLFDRFWVLTEDWRRLLEDGLFSEKTTEKIFTRITDKNGKRNCPGTVSRMAIVVQFFDGH